MNEFLFVALALPAGLLLGGFFFGGLWWTVTRGVSSPRAALWFFGSMLLRTSVTAAGFCLVGREDWKRWLLCLLGFVLARLITERLILPLVEHHNTRRSEARHAP